MKKDKFDKICDDLVDDIVDALNALSADDVAGMAAPDQNLVQNLRRIVADWLGLEKSRARIGWPP